MEPLFPDNMSNGDYLNPKEQGIMDIIMAEGHGAVGDLCGRLRFSESTVRRLLLSLEEKKLVRRYHGGATLVRQNYSELPVPHRAREGLREKRRIARAAAAHIAENDSILLTGGTTVAALCEFLPDIPRLTVITDSMLVANTLGCGDKPRLILLGGQLNSREQCTEGILATSNMKALRWNKMFLGIKGISEKDGFLTDDVRQAEFYQSCRERSDQLIVLADHRKFYQDGVLPLFSCTQVDILITDDKARPDVCAGLERQGCRVEIAGNDSSGGK